MWYRYVGQTDWYYVVAGLKSNMMLNEVMRLVRQGRVEIARCTS